jgi:hypothetical protein
MSILHIVFIGLKADFNRFLTRNFEIVSCVRYAIYLNYVLIVEAVF